jgi:phage-related protein
MADIYNTSNWAASTSYRVNDIVIYGSNYYYCTLAHTSTSNFTNDSSSYWNGVLNYRGRTLPYFFWKIDYNYSLNIEPVIKSIKFGDGYEQTLPDGINNILLPFDIEFANRDLAEHTAISHFFYVRGGYGKFYFTPPAPYNVVKIFACPKWTSTQPFYDDYTTRATFTEKTI